MRRLLPVFAILIFGAACSTPATTPTPVDLHATVRMNGLTITIANQDTFAWQSVRVRLNPAVLRSGYEITVPSIPVGRSSEIPLVNFSNSDGLRFDPLTMIVKEVWLSVPTAQGTALWTGTWGQ